ncbi:hypothetical protein LEMLEM_LOCUS8927, partial [Lemmus lemmus]
MAPGSRSQHRGPGQNIPSVWRKLAEVSVVCSDHSPFVEISCETPVCRSNLAGTRVMKTPEWTLADPEMTVYY